jgi:short-subunit dehydrogenase
MKNSLDGKVVLLTGASRGLGVDMARAFAARKARLALAARSAEELETVRKEIIATGATAVAIPADVGDQRSLKSLVEKTEQALGPIDVLVNNAGIEQVCEFEDMALEDIARIVQVNVTGLIWLTRLVLPSMIRRRSGHVVNLASVAGLTAVPHNAVYSASKHAVVGISRSLRAEMADHGIGVSVVCPGFVDGGMFSQWGRKPPKMAGMVSPQSVAAAVVSAVERNRAEVVVNKGLGKITDWFVAVAPDFTIGVMNRTGVVGFLREQAALNAKER